MNVYAESAGLQGIVSSLTCCRSRHSERRLRNFTSPEEWKVARLTSHIRKLSFPDGVTSDGLVPYLTETTIRGTLKLILAMEILLHVLRLWPQRFLRYPLLAMLALVVQLASDTLAQIHLFEAYSTGHKPTEP